MSKQKKKEEKLKPGDKYEVPAAGSLGLLALGDVGLKAWRKKRDKEFAKDQKKKKDEQ